MNERATEMASSQAQSVSVASVSEDRHQPESEHKQGGQGSVKPPFRPKGSSITLTGFGKRDGSDVNNSMDLATFYKFMLGV